MKKLLFLILPVLAACGGKDDDPKPEPTIYAKWHIDTKQTINTYYKGGVIIKKDTSLVYGKPYDYWEFKQPNTYKLYDQSGTREAFFNISGDSVYVLPGVIYPVKVVFRFELTHSGYLVMTNSDISYNTGGMDSTEHLIDTKLTL